MKNIMIRGISVILSLLYLTSCGAIVIKNENGTGTNTQNETVPKDFYDKIKVPDVMDIEFETACQTLADEGFGTFTQYEYSSSTPAGCVTRTIPAAGSYVDEASEIIVYVSKGPSNFMSESSTINFYNLSSTKDEWNFYSPYIDNGILYIPFEYVKLYADVSWFDPAELGYISGYALIDSMEDSYTPVYGKYQYQSVDSGNTQDFTLEIPLLQYNGELPEIVDYWLFAYVNDEYTEMPFTLEIVW